MAPDDRALGTPWMLVTLALSAGCTFAPVAPGVPGDGLADAARDLPDAARPGPARDAGAPGDAAADARGEVDLTRGLVGYWPLDEIDSSGGGTTPDRSGNRFDGEVDGPELVAGRVGMALRFDGDDDAVIIGNRAALDAAGPITIAAWIDPTLVGGDIRNIVAHGNTNEPPREVFLRIAANEQYEGGCWDNADHKAALAIPLGDVVGSWIHLATVYDGQDWVLYRNGVEVNRGASAVGALNVNENWFIGARLGSAADRYFQGDIDEVRIYNRALSPAEIAALAAP